MSISAKVFARIGGQVITQYTLQSPAGLTLRLLTFGARIQQVRLPAAGKDPNLILGFITLQDYLSQPGAFGALVGPDATNTRANWANWNWRATTASGPDFDRVTFTLTLGDGADGQPGARTIEVAHTLTATNEWQTAVSIATTQPVSLAPSYRLAWQLSGDPAQTILGEQLTVGGQARPVPTAATTVPAAPITLSAAPWTLDYQTDAAMVTLDPLASVTTTNNFNGILGQPHVGLVLAPQLAHGELTPGPPATWHTTITLHAN